MKFYNVCKEELPNGFYESVHRVSQSGAEESYMALSEEEAAEKCIRTGNNRMCENCTYDGEHEETCPIFFAIKGDKIMAWWY